MCEYEETLLRLKENKIKGEATYLRVELSYGRARDRFRDCLAGYVLWTKILRKQKSTNALRVYVDLFVGFNSIPCGGMNGCSNLVLSCFCGLQKMNERRAQEGSRK